MQYVHFYIFFLTTLKQIKSFQTHFNLYIKGNIKHKTSSIHPQS